MLRATRERPLDPWVVATWGPLEPRLTVTESPATASQPANQFSYDVELRAGSSHPSLVSLDFSGLPAALAGRATGDVLACAAPRGSGLFADPSVRSEVVSGRRSTFGAGWGPLERIGGTLSHELRATEGELLLASARSLAVRVAVTLTAADRDGTIALVANGTALESHGLARRTDATIAWTVPASLWRAGMNQLFVTSHPGVRVKGVEISEF
jgi:hypothetical protein